MSPTIHVTRAQLKNGLKLEVNRFYRVQLVPELECVRLLGFFFDTNKTFILPGTLD